MAKFLTSPSYKKIKEADSFGRARWVQVGILVFVDDDYVTYMVPDGFETDFASVPRLPLAYFLAGDTAHYSAVLHDYVLREKLLDWNAAAKLFNRAMRAEGVTPWRRWLMYVAVKYFGKPFA